MANDNQKPIIDHSLDDYFQTTALGSLERAIGNNLYGINHLQTPGLVPSNKDMPGYTFFTRPQLNLQTDNLRNDRKFYPLLTERSDTTQRAIRCLLDPRLMVGYVFGKNQIAPIPCPVIDNANAFIPMLTNNLSNISGWPDMTVSSFISKPGLYKETWGQVDGVVDNYENYDLTATFRNTRGAPIMGLFYYWMRYQSLVLQGQLVPYLDYITDNRIDYNTRIYRLTVDQSKTYVTNICAGSVAWPVSNPTGALFDVNNETVFNDQIKDISIQFKTLGFEWQDDILINEFNATVVIFNPSMHDKYRENDLLKIGAASKALFNHRCYPRINPYNFELEWWVPKSIYDNKTNAFLAANAADYINEEGD